MPYGHLMNIHMLHMPLLPSPPTDHSRCRQACDRRLGRPGSGIYALSTWEAISLALTGDTCWSQISARLELLLHTPDLPAASGPHCLPPSSTASIMWAHILYLAISATTRSGTTIMPTREASGLSAFLTAPFAAPSRPSKT